MEGLPLAAAAAGKVFYSADYALLVAAARQPLQRLLDAAAAAPTCACSGVGERAGDRCVVASSIMDHLQCRQGRMECRQGQVQ